MPKQIKQMKISQPQNQVKTHRQIVRMLREGKGRGREDGEGEMAWVPQMLCLIGISWVLSCSLATLDVVVRLGSMTTFFFELLRARLSASLCVPGPEIEQSPGAGQNPGTRVPAACSQKSGILTSGNPPLGPHSVGFSFLTFVRQTICGMPLSDAYRRAKRNYLGRPGHSGAGALLR